MLKLKTSTLRVQHYRLKRQLLKVRGNDDGAPPQKSAKCDTQDSSDLPPSSSVAPQESETIALSNDTLASRESVKQPVGGDPIMDNVEDVSESLDEPQKILDARKPNECLCACCAGCTKGQITRDESHVAGDVRILAKRLALPYNHVDAILKTFKPYHPSLPLSHKTLMRHHEKPEIETLPSSDPLADTAEFVYFGISDHLKKTVNVKLHPDKILPLQFNFDGLSLFNSSKRELWCGLGKVYTRENIYDPFVELVHSGIGKPKCVCQYLWKFIMEVNELLANGITIDGVHFKVKIKSMVCDTPARAFIKCVKGHTGFFACERCTVRGFKLDSTTVFPLDEGTLRTDESFRSQENEGHHNGISPLLLIHPHINMIYLFVLDFMHLICLGTSKKLISDYWLKPSFKILTRMDVLRISTRLTNLNNQIPVEFQRTTKSLQKISEWEATEHRFIVLYAGSLVFKGILPEIYYKNILLLYIACRIQCSQDYYKKYFNLAKQYLDKFVKTASHPSLYGLKALVINLHNISHMADDVENMDCNLMDFSAFPFENLLGKLKRLVESGNKPLAQLINKMNDYLNCEKAEKKSDFEVLKEKKKKDDQGLHQFERIRLEDCQLAIKKPDNIVLLKTGQIMKIKSIKAPSAESTLSEICIGGTLINIIGPALTYPCDSSALNMYQVSDNDSNPTIESNLSLVKCKMILLNIFELEDDPKESYAMPLLHMN